METPSGRPSSFAHSGALTGPRLHDDDPWWRIIRLPEEAMADFHALYWHAQRGTLRGMACLALLLVLGLMLAQHRALAGPAQWPVFGLRIGLICSLGVAAFLTTVQLTPKVRSAIIACLTVVGLLQVAVQGTMIHYRAPVTIALVPFLMSLVMFYLVSAVGIARSRWICLGCSLAYLIMLVLLVGTPDYVTVMSVALANLAGYTSGLVIERLLRTLFLAERAARTAALVDPLTQLPNRRAIMDHAERLLGAAKRDGSALMVCIVDIDHFKRLNDLRGHLVGDRALLATAGALESVARRPLDLAGRMGGEEFLVVAPLGNQEGGDAYANRLCAAVRDMRFAHPGTEGGMLTASVGCWWGTPTVQTTLEQLLHHADIALYRAKDGGRNRAEVDNFPPD